MLGVDGLPSLDVPAIAELARHRQWVLWRLVTRPGQAKPTKSPVRPDGRPAATTQPATWTSYDAAVRAHVGQAAGKTDGIGFVFRAEDPYTGVDLDGAIAADGTLADWADEIVVRLDSFTETSPSGRGLHVIVRGALPAGRRRFGPVELYDWGRYFTMTGAVHGGRDAIMERGEVLAALHAELCARHGETDGAVPDGAIKLPPLTDEDSPPAEKLTALLENSLKFRQSWRHTRKDMADQSLSSFDLSLAIFAVEAEWSDVEIAKLIVAHRRKYGETGKGHRPDYLCRTIARARSAIASRTPEPEVIATASLEEAAERGQKEALSEISARLGVQIDGAIKRGDDPAWYYLVIADRLFLIGRAGALMSQSAVAERLYEAIGRAPLPVKPTVWVRMINLLSTVMTHEPLPEADAIPAMLDRVVGYVETSAFDEENWKTAVPASAPFYRNGHAYLNVEGLHRELAQTERISRNSLVHKLRQAGFKSQGISVRIKEGGKEKLYHRKYHFIEREILFKANGPASSLTLGDDDDV